MYRMMLFFNKLYLKSASAMNLNYLFFFFGSLTDNSNHHFYFKNLVLPNANLIFTSPSGGFKHKACVISSESECVDSPTPRSNT